MALDNIVLFFAREVSFTRAWDEDPTVTDSHEATSDARPGDLPVSPPVTPNGAEASPGRGLAPQSPVHTAFSFLQRIRQGTFTSTDELLESPTLTASRAAEGDRPPGLEGAQPRHASPEAFTVQPPVEATAGQGSPSRPPARPPLTRLQEIQLLLLYKTAEVSSHGLAAAAAVLLLTGACLQLQAAGHDKITATRGLYLVAGILLFVSFLCYGCAQYVLSRFLAPLDRGFWSQLASTHVSAPLGIAAALTFLSACSFELAAPSYQQASSAVQAASLAGLALATGLAAAVGAAEGMMPSRNGFMSKATASGPYALHHFMGMWMFHTGVVLLAVGYCMQADAYGVSTGPAGTGWADTRAVRSGCILIIVGGAWASMGGWLAAGASAEYIQPPIPSEAAE